MGTVLKRRSITPVSLPRHLRNSATDSEEDCILSRGDRYDFVDEPSKRRRKSVGCEPYPWDDISRAFKTPEYEQDDYYENVDAE